MTVWFGSDSDTKADSEGLLENKSETRYSNKLKGRGLQSWREDQGEQKHMFYIYMSSGLLSC